MKIIHTSDWHIGKIVNDFSMLEDQAYFLCQLIDYLKQQKADALIVAGDIYDRSIPPAKAVSLVNDTLVEIIGGLHIPVILIAGNHDSPQRLSFAHTLLEQSGLYICGEVRRPPGKNFHTRPIWASKFLPASLFSASRHQTFVSGRKTRQLSTRHLLCLNKRLNRIFRRTNATFRFPRIFFRTG